MSALADKVKQHPRASILLALLLFCGISLFIRAYYPFDSVFYDDWVSFQSTDPWYHMRHIENLIHNFPSLIQFDPYGFYPTGSYTSTAPFFDFAIGLIAWVLGAGSPSRAVVEGTGAWTPALFGALMPVPVYFIGRQVFGRGAGLLAAALIAILPGQFLVRTLLGYTDHHAAEILFSTLTMLFLLLAITSARDSEATLESARSRDWKALRRPLVFSLLTAVALGLYLLSWASGAFLVFIVMVFFVLQHIVDHARRRSTEYLFLVGAPVLLLTAVIVAPFLGQYRLADMQMASLASGLLALVVLSGTSRLMSRRGIGIPYYLLTLAVLASIGATLLWLLDPGLFDSIVDRMGLAFNPGETSLTIAEVGGLSVSSAWEYFGPAFYISLASLVAVLYMVVRKGAPGMSLLLVWSLIVLIATLGQQRFAFYLAMNMALLTAFLCWSLLQAVWRWRPGPIASEAAGSAALPAPDSKLTRKARRKMQKQAARKQQAPVTARLLRSRYLLAAITLIVIFFLAFYPNIRKATVWADAPRGPHPDWHEALVWMKDNTPEPFPDPSFYYASYEKPVDRESRLALRPSYGVMSWWDYGYWITYIAHRAPNANPGQRGATDAALFLTAQDESAACEVLDRVGSKYAVLDLRTAIPSIDPESGVYGYFSNIVEWAGEDSSDFFGEYYAWKDGQLLRVLCYYPAYYQTMCVRLYVFQGQEVVPEDSTWVVSFVEKTDSSGVTYKEILDTQRFATYEEAEEYLAEQDSPNMRIVSNSAFASPVPLDELEHFQLVYKSSTRATTSEARNVSWVEVFEYLP